MESTQTLEEQKSAQNEMEPQQEQEQQPPLQSYQQEQQQEQQEATLQIHQDSLYIDSGTSITSLDQSDDFLDDSSITPTIYDSSITPAIYDSSITPTIYDSSITPAILPIDNTPSTATVPASILTASSIIKSPDSTPYGTVESGTIQSRHRHLFLPQNNTTPSMLSNYRSRPSPLGSSFTPADTFDHGASKHLLIQVSKQWQQNRNRIDQVQQKCANLKTLVNDLLHPEHAVVKVLFIVSDILYV